MATAPKAIWDLWYAIEAAYNGPGLQDEELAGIVGDRLHSFGFHLAPVELPSSDYSLQTSRDRAGARTYPGDASALDVHFGPSGMKTVTARLIAAAQARDPRMNCLYEFCGTTNGSTPHPYTVDTHTNDVNNTQGWDDSHVTHVHLSFHRDVCNNFAAIKGIADIIAGTATDPLEELMAMYADKAAFEKALRGIVHDELAKQTRNELLPADAAAADTSKGPHRVETYLGGIPGYVPLSKR